jgi:serine/threonine protein kinase
MSSRKIDFGLGFVFEAYDYKTGKKVALKRTQKVGLKVSREFEVLDEARGCPNVVQMTDFFYSIDWKDRIIQNIVLELCDMSLYDVLENFRVQEKAMPMAQIKHYCKQIFQGLDQLH